MARPRAVTVERNDADQLEAIEDFYRRRLAAPATLPSSAYPPVTIGPTWQVENGRWVLPDHTIGWAVLAWCGRWLELATDDPWVFTDEQARFVLWWYAVDDNGFLFRDGTLQRLKGWGKDPVVAALGLNGLSGPCRFGGFENGRPVALLAHEPWVQLPAVSLEQTKNTMRLLPGLASKAAIAEYGWQIGKEQVHARGGGLLQAVTSSPATLEGARATEVFPNETQHWDSSNAGHDMADVLERNATKSKDGAARTLRITNAYEPGQDSVAERDREAWEAVRAGRTMDTGILHDSLEAPPDAPLSVEAAPEVVRGVRGDSVWLNIDRIVQSIADSRNPPSRSRRFWYNQIVAAEDAWTTPQYVDDTADPRLVEPGTRCFLFLDGSKSDDSTALHGCRQSDGYVFTLGIWQRPANAEHWIVSREDVDHRVRDAFDLWDPVGFWVDPSNARDDDTGERFWEPYIDDWSRDFGDRLELVAVEAGRRAHPITWDMRWPSHQEVFVEHAERFASDLADGTLRHDGNELLKQHLKNARRRPNKYGVSFGKEHRDSPRKVDGAVAAVGARMMWRLAAAKPAKAKKHDGGWYA